MSCFRVSSIAANTKSEYATRDDFRSLFTEHINSLYLLSFLLTANHEKAEQCFVTGLDECVTGSPVFREWACTWARRIIVRNAIQMIAPSAGRAVTTPITLHFSGNRDLRTLSLQDAQFADVLTLDKFERFVYVLSVLEKYSDQDCATLLDVSRQEIREARGRAFQQIAESSRAAAAPMDDLCDAVMD